MNIIPGQILLFLLLSVSGCYSIYGFEYRPGNDGFITWVSEGKASWTMRGAGMKGEPDIQMGSRPVPLEPMYSMSKSTLSLHPF